MTLMQIKNVDVIEKKYRKETLLITYIFILQ